MSFRFQERKMKLLNLRNFSSFPRIHSVTRIRGIVQRLLFLHIVPLTIWHQLFLEFWLVKPSFFADPRDQRAVTFGVSTWRTCCNFWRTFLPRKCTPVKYKVMQKAGFPIVTHTLLYNFFSKYIMVNTKD